MIKNMNDAIDIIKNNSVEAVDLKFCDLWGRWHHVTISRSEFNDNLQKTGVGFDGSSVGLKDVHAGDMVLIPDLTTGILDPFWEKPTLSFICNIMEAVSKERFRLDPRGILRKAESFLVDQKIADKSLWGPEFEFYLFSDVSFENTANTSRYSVDSSEGFWNNSLCHSVNPLPKHGGYHAIPPGDQLFNLRAEIVSSLEKIGVPVKYHHHEVGGPGQCEIETPILEAMQAADTCMLIKYFAKMTANRHGMVATFLPKPLFGEAGSGMHFHQLLFKDNKNVFYDKSGSSFLSDMARYYIGGMLKHAPALLAFTNPSTNSYRRLVPGYEAPINCFYSTGNRSAAIRVPMYATDPDKVRFEFRPPDASCNPYLAIAAMLMAGIDGIVNKIDPNKAGFGPFDEDILSMSPEKRAKIVSLPSSLDGAISALERDHEFLLSGDVFYSDLIETWITRKKQEDNEIKIRPHPYEIQLDFDI